MSPALNLLPCEFDEPALDEVDALVGVKCKWKRGWRTNQR